MVNVWKIDFSGLEGGICLNVLSALDSPFLLLVELQLFYEILSVAHTLLPQAFSFDLVLTLEWHLVEPA